MERKGPGEYGKKGGGKLHPSFKGSGGAPHSTAHPSPLGQVRKKSRSK
jgi:hypothetical protein